MKIIILKNSKAVRILVIFLILLKAVDKINLKMKVNYLIFIVIIKKRKVIIIENK